MKYIGFLFITCLFFNCGTTEQPSQVEETALFGPLVADFTTTAVKLPDGLKADILFSEAIDSVIKANGSICAAPGSPDFMAFLPIDGNNEHGYLYINHETANWNDSLGDGGGGSVIEIKRENGTWKRIGTAKHVDFSPVGGTVRNCGGAVTPSGTILTAEEWEPQSNKDIYSAYRDTSKFDGRASYLNFGWVTEVDPKSGKALRKLYQMGRMEHEGIYCDADKKTVYLTDDASPCVFYKFVADKAGDYSQGQLYAFQETNDGGNWLKMPMQMDSLMQTRNIALRMGATMYVRNEWTTGIGGKIYINETGADEVNWAEAIAIGGQPAAHHASKMKDGKFNDPYGRVLVFDPSTNKMSVLIEGGTADGDSTTNLASPDCIGAANINGKDYLVIHEDLIGQSKNRVSQMAEANKATFNEIYFLDLSIAKPTVKDLKRFMMGPKGCETSGGAFSPDASTYFVAIQHPDTSNPEPYKRNLVIAVSGFKK
ncbi:MAG: DUF839 domain-containing protein [Chitinophagales bacterium]|nr:DUF839 domain-containing protein [Chitinophagales bacterium]